jgi:hypothetical protein
MSHAKLGPSAAERWMTCPGSVVLSEGMPNKSSVFAEEGTQAHELAEKLLSGSTFTINADEPMLDNVMVYVEHVTGLGGKLHVEQRVRVTDNLWGTADAVVWQPEDNHLHIVDLKYGAGVPVEVIGNLQLKIYALATLLTFEYPAERVTATIVQPRCPHSDGPVRSITFDVVDLVDFHADLVEAIEMVDEAAIDGKDLGVKDPDWVRTYVVPSDKGCRWCLASPICPKLKGMAQDAAKKVFAKGQVYDPAELAATLDTLPLLEGWIKNVREFAYEEAERGSVIPDWKLVEKRATRKWRDEDEAARHLGQLDFAIFDKPKLLSPAALEKLLPKDQRAMLDALCTKESSGHTLVHGSDKRPAIKVDAKSAFANS